MNIMEECIWCKKEIKDYSNLDYAYGNPDSVNPGYIHKNICYKEYQTYKNKKLRLTFLCRVWLRKIKRVYQKEGKENKVKEIDEIIKKNFTIKRVKLPLKELVFLNKKYENFYNRFKGLGHTSQKTLPI